MICSLTKEIAMTNKKESKPPEVESPDDIHDYFSSESAVSESTESAGAESEHTEIESTETIPAEIESPNVEPTKQSTKYKSRKLYELEINELHPDPNQPRKIFEQDDLSELADSIVKHGVLQPILFRKETDGRLLLISGERMRIPVKPSGDTDGLAATIPVGMRPPFR